MIRAFSFTVLIGGLALALACARRAADLTILLECADRGEVTRCLAELEKGFDAKRHNELSHKVQVSPLHLAAGGGSIEILKAFLDRGLLVDFALADGSTPLHFAVIGRQSGSVKLLLAHGANPDAVSGSGSGGGIRPLDFAAQAGNSDMVDILLKAGADPNSGGRMTALSSAAIVGHTTVVKQLIKAGARVDMTTARLTRDRGHKQTARILFAELCRPLQVLPIPEVDEPIRQANDSIRQVRRSLGCP
ncbi:MAG: ankyrin repeat domain-containing protein [Bryobacterales bacterium]|nr:ankyrin repeat domain-containing protein [Bryobacterales bacterium]